jgi:hypothetical protein
MTTYKGIQGFGVETLASDPTEPGSVGQIFYNSTEGVFKTVKPGGVSYLELGHLVKIYQLEEQEQVLLEHKQLP